MPTTVTYSVNVAIDKGPTIKGEAKLNMGLFSAAVEEEICPGAKPYAVELKTNVDDIEMLVITADKFKNDKDPCSNPATPTGKTLKFKFEPSDCSGPGLYCECKDKKPTAEHKSDWCDLTQPFVMTKPFLGKAGGRIDNVVFQNDLASSVKVSVLVVHPRPKDCQCAQ